VGDVSAFAAATATESLDLSSQLELDNIREALIRQEDTIIFCVIERAQFAANSAVYQPDAVPVPEFAADGSRYSLLEYILRQTEQIHGRIRRFTSPDEHAFYPDSVPALVLPPLKYPEVSTSCAQVPQLQSPIVPVKLQMCNRPQYESTQPCLPHVHWLWMRTGQILHAG
jgi:chorismate mutase